jgi:hypothetical protein
VLVNLQGERLEVNPLPTITSATATAVWIQELNFKSSNFSRTINWYDSLRKSIRYRNNIHNPAYLLQQLIVDAIDWLQESETAAIATVNTPAS